MWLDRGRSTMQTLTTSWLTSSTFGSTAASTGTQGRTSTFRCVTTSAAATSAATPCHCYCRCCHRCCCYLQARDNKRSTTVRDIFVQGCREEGWSSRTRWDKGSENVLAICEQVNRHYDPSQPETGARGSALTGRSIDNTRIEGFWRYVREQVTDQFCEYSGFELVCSLPSCLSAHAWLDTCRARISSLPDTCFDGMRRLSKVLNVDDRYDMFALHAVFLHPMLHGDGEYYSVIQRALDDMRAMWNEHPIRKRCALESRSLSLVVYVTDKHSLSSVALLCRPTIHQAHFGGVPSLLFQRPVRSSALFDLDDDAFYLTRGTLRDGPDANAAATAVRVRTFASSAEEDAAFEQARGPTARSDGVDEDGTFGVEVRATREEPESAHIEARTQDPLSACDSDFGLLVELRTLYLQQMPLAGFSAYAGVTPYIQEYIRFKCVCVELLTAWSHFWVEGTIDWGAFSGSVSADAYAVSCDMRADLASIALSLSG